MMWKKFKGQKLNTSDLVWFKDSGLAFVDSSLSTGQPDRFSSIPEGWSFGDVDVNQRSFDKWGAAHVRENGWVYQDKRWGGKKFDRITHVMRIKKPVITEKK